MIEPLTEEQVRKMFEECLQSEAYIRELSLYEKDKVYQHALQMANNEMDAQWPDLSELKVGEYGPFCIIHTDLFKYYRSLVNRLAPEVSSKALEIKKEFNDEEQSQKEKSFESYLINMKPEQIERIKQDYQDSLPAMLFPLLFALKNLEFINLSFFTSIKPTQQYKSLRESKWLKSTDKAFFSMNVNYSNIIKPRYQKFIDKAAIYLKETTK